MNNKKTFHEVSEIWCDAKRPIVKHSTLCAYQLALQTHLLPRFGAAENITEKDVQQFVIDKCTSGLARKTVRDIVAVLKSVVKYGNKHGIFHFEEWEIEYPTQTENKLPPTLSLNHQRILMRHLLEQPTPQNIGVLLALFLQALKMVRKQSQSPYVVGTSTQSKEPRSYRDYFERLLKRLDIPHLVFQ